MCIGWVKDLGENWEEMASRAQIAIHDYQVTVNTRWARQKTKFVKNIDRILQTFSLSFSFWNHNLEKNSSNYVLQTFTESFSNYQILCVFTPVWVWQIQISKNTQMGTLSWGGHKRMFLSIVAFDADFTNICKLCHGESFCQLQKKQQNPRIKAIT